MRIPKCLVAVVLGVCLLGASTPTTYPAFEKTWSQTRAMPATEANQAAAADRQFVYAITNAVIAKYDRQTGQRVAVSTGSAHHLNSGFFHEGKLYCAHSNFPKIPEKSEIIALDAQSMQLTVFKDFGNYGGSITWVLRHDGYWWCNFARYGKNNGESFLVKFDDQWNELARWTYPAELLRYLGKNSLSGAVWRDGELLATGHDDPVVFRLKAPPTGKTLQLMGVQSVPFEGQGIALDPVTGGMVGISRRKRQVLFAEPQ